VNAPRSASPDADARALFGLIERDFGREAAP
jgi:hypothetical protein